MLSVLKVTNLFFFFFLFKPHQSLDLLEGFFPLFDQSTICSKSYHLSLFFLSPDIFYQPIELSSWIYSKNEATNENVLFFLLFFAYKIISPYHRYFSSLFISNISSSHAYIPYIQSAYIHIKIHSFWKDLLGNKTLWKRKYFILSILLLFLHIKSHPLFLWNALYLFQIFIIPYITHIRSILHNFLTFWFPNRKQSFNKFLPLFQHKIVPPFKHLPLILFYLFIIMFTIVHDFLFLISKRNLVKKKSSFFSLLFHMKTLLAVYLFQTFTSTLSFHFFILLYLFSFCASKARSVKNASTWVNRAFRNKDEGGRCDNAWRKL